jgi:thiamine biosynthesis protein ThiI
VDPAADETFLIRYGEIGLKSLPVRRRFEALLAQQLQKGVEARGAKADVTRTWARLFVRAPSQQGRDAIAHTFGVVSFSPVLRAPAALQQLAEFAGREAGIIPAKARFAVRARRSGETGYTSQDVARAVGTSVLELHRERGLTVDLDAPDVEVVVEVRDGEAWVAFETLAGPGGLPVGSEGRVAAWLEDARDAAAAWLMMKRGCRVTLLAPEGADVEALAKSLAAWDPGIELTQVPFPDRDAGLRLALLEALARRRKASGLVLGEGFEEALASAAGDRSVALPVFRPLLALDAPAEDRIAQHLGFSLGPRPPTAMARTDPALLREAAEQALRGARRRKVDL